MRKRGVAVDDKCPLCDNAAESEEHLFRLYPIAQMVWRASNLGIFSEAQHTVHMSEWIIIFLNYFYNQDGKDDTRIVQLISIMWAIWLHRNEILFRGVSVNPNNILDLAQSHVQRWNRMKEVKEALISQQSQSQKPDSRGQVTMWRTGTCHTRDFFSIVVDAAWNRKKKVKNKQWESSIGWAEDVNQVAICSGAKRIFAQNALQAECYAILEGIKMASEISQNVVVKTDCKQAVEALINVQKAPSNIITLVEDIQLEARKLDYLVCMKVSRDVVAKAHTLAQQERKGFSG